MMLALYLQNVGNVRKGPSLNNKQLKQQQELPIEEINLKIVLKEKDQSDQKFKEI